MSGWRLQLVSDTHGFSTNGSDSEQYDVIPRGWCLPNRRVEEGWLIDFCTWLGEMVRLSDSSRSRYISDIRFPHLVSGYQDYAKWGTDSNYRYDLPGG